MGAFSQTIKMCYLFVCIIIYSYVQSVFCIRPSLIVNVKIIMNRKYDKVEMVECTCMNYEVHLVKNTINMLKELAGWLSLQFLENFLEFRRILVGCINGYKPLNYQL